jgi:uncharacterized membrane protein YfcA
MHFWSFTLLVGIGSFVAGFLGSLTGLGGGVVLVPLLTLAFGVDIRYAIGASLVSVIATSSGAAAAYLREGYINMRIGMFLQVATSIGALLGAFIAGMVSASFIGAVFGIVLLHAAYSSSKVRIEEWGVERPPDRIAAYFKMEGTYPTPEGPQSYRVRAVPAGFALMTLAGTLSGLLGIGSGAMKVLAMDQAMRLPFKVSTTTSNFLIGVTAATSAGVYLNRGYIDPVLAMPVMLGVLAGSAIGAKLLPSASTRMLRTVFSIVIALMGLQMIFSSLAGRF